MANGAMILVFLIGMIMLAGVVTKTTWMFWLGLVLLLIALFLAMAFGKKRVS